MSAYIQGLIIFLVQCITSLPNVVAALPSRILKGLSHLIIAFNNRILNNRILNTVKLQVTSAHVQVNHGISDQSNQFEFFESTVKRFCIGTKKFRAGKFLILCTKLSSE